MRSTGIPRFWFRRAVIGVAVAALIAILLPITAPDGEAQEQPPSSCTTGIWLSATPRPLSEGASSVTFAITARWVSGTDVTARVVNYTIAFPMGVTTSPTTLTGSVTIASGQASGSANHASLTLSGLDNTVIDSPARNVTISGTAPASIGVCSTTVPITDNDNAVTLTLSSGGSALTAVDEGSSTQVTVTASLPSGSTVSSSATDLTISVGGGSGDTAVAGTDFTSVSDFTLTIAANMLSGTANFTLASLNTIPFGGSKRLTVSGSATGFVFTGAQLTINDQTTVTLALSSGGSALTAVDEGSSTQVTVTASLPSGSTVSSSATDLTISVGGGSGDTAVAGTDFTSVSDFTLTIAANSLSGTANFTLASLNTIPFGGSKRLTVSSSTSGVDVTGVQLTINDQTTVTLALSSGGSALSSVVEGSSTQVTVTASLPSGSTVSSSATDLTISVGGGSGDTAVAGTDFTSVTPFTLTIAANSLSGTADFTLASTANTVPDGGSKRLTVSSSTSGFDVTGAQLTITAQPASPTQPTDPSTPVPPPPPSPPPPSPSQPSSPSLEDEQQTLTLAETLPGWSACLGPARRATRFTDVADWDADPAIRCATYYRITVGRTPTLFAPTEQVPRWQMALFMYRAAGPAGLDLPAEIEQGFTDIDGLAEEARRAANAVAQMGIMPGAEDGRFNPQGLVTRRSMALILHGFLQAAVLQSGVTLGGAGSASTGFTDLAGLSAAERRAVTSLHALGVVRGADADSFAPDDTVTRVQMMRLIARALAYTIARPVGVSMQADRGTAVGRDVDLVISVRDEDFRPVTSAPVDIFFARAAGDAFSDDGRCLTGLLFVFAGSQVCQIDRDDPVTGPVGDLRVRITEIISGQRVWAWSGAQGARVTDLVRFARLLFVL